ncbi:GTPase, putative [Plasmodium reichenowi]|uniref:GTPase, putative n=1 Tax=Plasmodium reichenowi TaxID=5854 RepID=A0A151LK32_PLARE|nr:GTPase, putative [Plasmodium reichenowi]KYN99262.1 GTPase, putative [Plasmodium reichenowi]
MIKRPFVHFVLLKCITVTLFLFIIFVDTFKGKKRNKPKRFPFFIPLEIIKCRKEMHLIRSKIGNRKMFEKKENILSLNMEEESFIYKNEQNKECKKKNMDINRIHNFLVNNNIASNEDEKKKNICDNISTYYSEPNNNIINYVTNYDDLRREYLLKIMSDKETIYALSSGNVRSAISVIRISGPLSKMILEILLHKGKDKKKKIKNNNNNNINNNNNNNNNNNYNNNNNNNNNNYNYNNSNNNNYNNSNNNNISYNNYGKRQHVKKDNINRICNEKGTTNDVYNLSYEASGNEELGDYNLHDIIHMRKNMEARKLYMGKLYDKNNDIIDIVMYSYFKEPKSYTGEELVEIYCHGNMLIVKEIMSAINNMNELFYKILNEERQNKIYNNDMCSFIEDNNNNNNNNNNNTKYDTNDGIIYEKIHECHHNFIKIRESYKGEFTRRAFENNKMSLLQIEGLKELLFCKQKVQKQIALNYMNGYAKNIYLKLKELLKELLVYTELKIDFEEEHITSPKEKEEIQNMVLRKIREAINHINYILEKNNVEDISNSFDILLFGNVNSGKSTLMNNICNNDISIVTNIKGSTIDIIQKNIQIFNNSYNLCDSAGVIESDKIKSLNEKNYILYEQNKTKKKKKKNIHKTLESMGIKKTLSFLKNNCISAFVLLNIKNYKKELTNIIKILNHNFKENINQENNKEKLNKNKMIHKIKIPYFIFCLNKCDLISTCKFSKIKRNVKKCLLANLSPHILKCCSKKIFFISSKNGYNIDILLKYFNEKMIKKRKLLFDKKYSHGNNIMFLPFERHKLYLKKAINHLFFIEKNIHNLTFDIISEEIKLAVNSLNRIIGTIKNQQILNKILDTFCIGK